MATIPENLYTCLWEFQYSSAKEISDKSCENMKRYLSLNACLWSSLFSRLLLLFINNQKEYSL